MINRTMNLIIIICLWMCILYAAGTPELLPDLIEIGFLLHSLLFQHNRKIIITQRYTVNICDILGMKQINSKNKMRSFFAVSFSILRIWAHVSERISNYVRVLHNFKLIFWGWQARLWLHTVHVHGVYMNRWY